MSKVFLKKTFSKIEKKQRMKQTKQGYKDKFHLSVIQPE